MRIIRYMVVLSLAVSCVNTENSSQKNSASAIKTKKWIQNRAIGEK